MFNSTKLLFEAMKYCEQTKVKSFEYEAEGLRIIIKKEPQGILVQTNDKESPKKSISEATVFEAEEKLYQNTATMNSKELISEMTGIFYDRSAPDQEPYLKIGKKINVDDVIGLVEVMKCFMEIKAAASGTVQEILISNGMMIEYGQPLAVIEEASA
ncbi:biotin carboxyl carrier domain-containing protein [Enterococcus sp. BWB1-3]|uniref:acetyl-CoA carboxylase n=1 Tax=unclassified Enterococcus TaxID=2608891 RepID=UPI0019221EC2|nr:MULTISPECIES: acetyl-CoA carboxylase [unclassified Enterococcus]MBL1228813.1 biotin carboxyl carrier domain-containing protein [Enterococcus sp. BWB1-3]MCB5953738.1 biotin carboxyl carrier domain-containing protein [Enterococcus sp. CWB-B31]